MAKRKEKKEKKLEDEKDESTKKEEFNYDIMISYCHADKELVHKIQRYLADQGFSIWIDREQIYGPGKIIFYLLEKNNFYFSNASHGGSS